MGVRVGMWTCGGQSLDFGDMDFGEIRFAFENLHFPISAINLRIFQISGIWISEKSVSTLKPCAFPYLHSPPNPSDFGDMDFGEIRFSSIYPFPHPPRYPPLHPNPYF